MGVAVGWEGYYGERSSRAESDSRVGEAVGWDGQ